MPKQITTATMGGTRKRGKPHKNGQMTLRRI
jgi:hypothetical protein